MSSGGTFDTVIFLTTTWDDPAGLASLFRTHNPHLGIRSVVNLSDLIDIPPEILRRARLVAVTTDVTKTSDPVERNKTHLSSLCCHLRNFGRQ
jgi:hypothetical protein